MADNNPSAAAEFRLVLEIRPSLEAHYDLVKALLEM